MRIRYLPVLTLCATAILAPGSPGALGVPISQPGKPAATAALPSPTKATATFAGGCFWCEETAFEGLSGVESVTSGYTGGQFKDPTYEQVSSGETGHAESVQVVFDPARISYARLLDVFWHNVDPLDGGGQFCDRGTQYRPAIFFEGPAQGKEALESKRTLETQARFHGKLAVEIVPASVFYPAEEYHQDFYKKSPDHYHAYRRGCGRDARLEQIWGTPEGAHK